MLKIENLVKRYGKFVAVDNLSLEIGRGSIFGFVGPNGAGKTTTMRIIAGLLKATSGNVYIDGILVSKNIGLLKQKIGYMPDFFGVYDDLRVTEYMDFYAGAYKIPVSQRAALTDSLLELVDLTDKKTAYVDSLSRGMKQRLCLARSLVHDPELLILDEPASGLDPRARVEMKEILKQLREMGKTIIISSHILPELAEMCTEVGIIDKGSLRAFGSIAEIMRLITKKRIFNVRTANGGENLVRLLEQSPAASDIIEKNDGAEFSAEAASDAEIAALLGYLVAQGALVTEFKEKEGNLEEIFMEVTGNENRRNA